MNAHLHRYPDKQPAVRFRDPHLPGPEPEQWITQKPRARRSCAICGQIRQCRNLNVQVAYDRTRYTCADTDCTPKRRTRNLLRLRSRLP